MTKIKKDLNTYDINVCFDDFFKEHCFEGLHIAVTVSAMRELHKLAKSMADVVEVLEFGKDAPRKRKKGTIEHWFTKGNKTTNVVIVKNYHEVLQHECWLLIHVGEFTKKQ